MLTMGLATPNLEVLFKLPQVSFLADGSLLGPSRSKDGQESIFFLYPVSARLDGFLSFFH